MLEDAGCLGGYDAEGRLCLYWTEARWNDEGRNALNEVLRQCGDAQAESTLTVHDIPDQDWNRRWTESLQPIRIGRRVRVRQSWNAEEIPPGGFELVIDPKRAFGTGYHATTQLIVEWLEDLIRGGERLLDVGTGSGILAMVALRLGARSVLAIDNDPEAIECAREYAAANGFGADLELRVTRLEEVDPEPFDLILANLDRKTLLPYFARFHGHLAPGGAVLISGLLRDDDTDISEALAATGWKICGRTERDEWLALELREMQGHPRD